MVQFLVYAQIWAFKCAKVYLPRGHISQGVITFPPFIKFSTLTLLCCPICCPPRNPLPLEDRHFWSLDMGGWKKWYLLWGCFFDQWLFLFLKDHLS